MKGVNKHVVEILEPQHEYIERVVVFLRQDKDNITTAEAQSEAENYVKKLVQWRRRPFKKALRPWQVASGVLLCVLVLAVAVVLLV